MKKNRFNISITGAGIAVMILLVGGTGTNNFFLIPTCLDSNIRRTIFVERGKTTVEVKLTSTEHITLLLLMARLMVT